MIIPAIDLIEGAVVRLHQGDYSQQTTYAKNPVEQLQSYANQGAQFLHCVDLTGAKNPQLRQIGLIKEIANTLKTPIQVGGGIRTSAEVETLLNNGVQRVVIGSMAITQSELVKSWFKQFGGEHLVLALDINIQAQTGEKLIAIHGWQETSQQTIESVIEDFSKLGLKHVLCTDISKDGTLKGPNVALYQELSAQYPHIALQSSGGIGSLNDVRALIPTGVQGVIIGRALLENKFTVKEAISCWQNA